MFLFCCRSLILLKVDFSNWGKHFDLALAPVRKNSGNKRNWKTINEVEEEGVEEEEEKEDEEEEEEEEKEEEEEEEEETEKKTLILSSRMVFLQKWDYYHRKIIKTSATTFYKSFRYSNFLGS